MVNMKIMWVGHCRWLGFDARRGAGARDVGPGLFGAAFSSPYQAIPVAIVIASVLLLHKQQQAVCWPRLEVFALCYAYYSGPQPTPGVSVDPPVAACLWWCRSCSA